MVLLGAAKGYGTQPPDLYLILSKFPAAFVSLSFYKVYFQVILLYLIYYLNYVYLFHFQIQFHYLYGYLYFFSTLDASTLHQQFNVFCFITIPPFFFRIFGYPTGLGALLV